MAVPYTKPALNYQEQLDLLKTRGGLAVKNEPKALHLLERVSYYRMSGYWYPMLATPKDQHIFKSNSTFENAFKLYCFDREFRQLVLGELEKIEIAVRAKLSYIYSHAHGPFWLNKSSLYKNSRSFSNSIAALYKEYSRSEEDFIKSFKKKYCDPLPPCWILLEVSSLGGLSMIYSQLKPGADKRKVANCFGLDDKTFSSWLHSLTVVRNICAHHSRLWNRKLGVSAKDPISPVYPFIASMGHLSNKPTYFILSMIIYFLNTINPNHSVRHRLYRLLKKYPMIDIKAMGFPDGWEKELLWNWCQVKKDERFYNKWLKSITK